MTGHIIFPSILPIVGSSETKIYISHNRDPSDQQLLILLTTH